MVPETEIRVKRLWLFAVGLVGGLFSGFFGVGGGLIMVPLLMWWTRSDQRRAHATSLLAIAPAATIAASGYAVGGVFPLVPGLTLALGAAIGAQLGSLLLHKIAIQWLRWGFIFFVASMALTTLFSIPEREAVFEISPASLMLLVAIGMLMGILAGLFGIGGGIIAIPLIVLLYGIGDIEAKAMSLIAMVPAAVSGSISNVRRKLTRIRDGLLVGSGSLISAPIGTYAAFTIPERSAHIAFGFFAIVTAGILAARALRKK